MNNEKLKEKKGKRKKPFLLFACFIFLLLGGAVFAQEDSPQEASFQEAVSPQEATSLQKAAAPAGQFEVWKEEPWALGAAYELGRNAREKVASGFAIGLDRYLFTPYVALGLRGIMNNDSVSVTSTEVQLNLRGYILMATNGNLIVSLFGQWGFGYSFYREEDRNKNTFNLDFLAGSRIYFSRGFSPRFLRGFYLEPYIRAGFPLLFSGGIAIGHWFSM